MDERPKWSDLWGIDPDYTDGACSVDFVRFNRGIEDPAEFEHVACWSLLSKQAES